MKTENSKNKKVSSKNQKTSSENNAYMIDVARSSSYQNQSEEYFQQFAQWRSKKDNPYGYDYVKDSREKTYVEGKGYVSDGPDKAEKASLASCCKLAGIMLILMQALTLFQMFIMPKFGGNSYISDSFYSIGGRSENATLLQVCVLSLFGILKLLIPIIVFFAVTKMPFEVVMPRFPGKNFGIPVSGMAFMLMAMTFGRYGNLLLSKLFGQMNIDVSSFNMLTSDDIRATIVYAISEYIVVSILIEIMFRGIILQTFRQFGDFFALVASCAFNCLYYGDITAMGYILMTSVIIGLFTLKSGSIYTAIFMRISARVINFGVSAAISYVGDEFRAYVEAFVSMIVIGFALFTYSRMLSNNRCDFNITDSYTHLKFKSKFLVMLTSKEMLLWLFLVFLSMTFNIRFLR